MVEQKLTRFFGMGAVIFIATAFLGHAKDNRLMIVGLVFAALALLCANIGNIRRKREELKTRLKTPRKY